jgi:carboxypeptidase Taq
MAMTTDLYQKYRTAMERVADIRFATSVLQWDQETYLPPKGAAARGRQISTLTEMAHLAFTDENLGGLLQELLSKDDLTGNERRNVEYTWEDYSKQQKYTPQLVRQLSDASNAAFHAWIEARKANSFATYLPDLDRMVQLKKQEADVLGYEHHPYNALLNEYEKGATVTLLDRTFDGLLPLLKDLLDRILAQPQVDDHFLKQHFPAEKQWEWGMWLVGQLGYDLEAGRQDRSEHPFSISFGADDVRITTRIDEQDFSNMTWSTIHEVGHALYEQGLPRSAYGLPGGEACSYSIHESQSRLWENNVGRSRAFCHHFFPHIQKYFPGQLQSVNEEQFFKAINKVYPSLVRTEADEITYHFHVYIRYMLEKKLLEGNLATADIPEFWNAHYQKLLGVTVPDDRQGCLQDVHWSHGSFGYFPTYSLGSLYAAQFYAVACKALPKLEAQIQAGQVQGLLQWLRRNVHEKGRLQTSEELCTALSGEGLNTAHFMRYVLDKYGTIYNLLS